ncbi:unnamed protein product [Urochloa humidicola]
MANYLPVMLTKECRNWLGGLPRDSINSWERLTELFTSNYHDMWERPGSKRLLGQLRRCKNKTLREFIQRFSEKRNSISFMDERDVITAFHRGIANGTLINRWTRKPPRTVNEMFTIANSWADGEEAEKEQLVEFKRNSISFVDEHDVITAFHRGIANGTLINRWTRKPPRTVNEMFAVANSWPTERKRKKNNSASLGAAGRKSPGLGAGASTGTRLNTTIAVEMFVAKPVADTSARVRRIWWPLSTRPMANLMAGSPLRSSRRCWTCNVLTTRITSTLHMTVSR